MKTLIYIFYDIGPPLFVLCPGSTETYLKLCRKAWKNFESCALKVLVKPKSTQSELSALSVAMSTCYAKLHNIFNIHSAPNKNRMWFYSCLHDTYRLLTFSFLPSIDLLSFLTAFSNYMLFFPHHITCLHFLLMITFWWENTSDDSLQNELFYPTCTK